MEYEISRTNAEIDDVINKAIEHASRPSRWPGMTYEQGVRDALDWVLGESDDNPMDE